MTLGPARQLERVTFAQWSSPEHGSQPSDVRGGETKERDEEVKAVQMQCGGPDARKNRQAPAAGRLQALSLSDQGSLA
jgi:hypothetical protein